MAYTATDVKNLRERTGAGMMDCKKALDDTNGDMEAAVDLLRAKGLAAVAKKSSRTAAEGLVGKVSSVSATDSVVTLLPDGSSAVSAKIVPGGAQGVVTAKIGTTGRFVLEFIDETRGIEEGQSVVTAGWREDDLASNYPPNLPIGEVLEVPIDTREAVRSVDIRPYPDFANLEFVTVLTGGSRG